MPDELGKPIRVQRKRTKGWRMPADTIYVGRGTRYGNPYKITERPAQWYANRPWGRQEAVWCYELMLASGYRLKRDPGYTIVRKAMEELEGKDLCCWCAIEVACHADILLKYANATVLLNGELSVT